MDGSDWVVVVFGGALIASFLVGLVLIHRVRLGLPVTFEIRSGAEIRSRTPADARRLRTIAREVAAVTPGCSVDDVGAFRFHHRGLWGRLDFISDLTEINVATGDHLRQIVEIVPVGFPRNLFQGSGYLKMRARGSRAEYDRIFGSPAEEQVLLEVGTTYDLRLEPGGMTFRLHGLPNSAAVLGFWLACAYRMIDLIVGFDAAVQVTEVADTLAENALCQICGSSLATGDVVRCRSCRTPHHESCWQYTGKCSTFGCGSVRFVR